jgi:hypothetical protein
MNMQMQLAFYGDDDLAIEIARCFDADDGALLAGSAGLPPWAKRPALAADGRTAQCTAWAAIITIGAVDFLVLRAMVALYDGLMAGGAARRRLQTDSAQVACS